jgi:hypothetical protein
MTDAERDELTAVIAAARKIAQPVGPMHSLWDMIFDAEALLAGQPTVLSEEAALKEVRRTSLPPQNDERPLWPPGVIPGPEGPFSMKRGLSTPWGDGAEPSPLPTACSADNSQGP